MSIIGSRSSLATDIAAALSRQRVDPAEERWQAIKELAQLHNDINSGKFAADRESERQAEAEAEARRKMTAAELIWEELAQMNAAPADQPARGSALPLNGPALSQSIKSALSGLGATVTINGV